MVQGTMSAHIAKVHARQIYDSRGKPTVEAEVILSDGKTFSACVPSGASTGVHEALELRDNDPKHLFGQGVLKAVANVNEVIGPALAKSKLDITNQRAIDEFLIQLDGTPNKSKLGANAILGVSLAVARGGASLKGVPLYRHIADMSGSANLSMPLPAFNIINGGSHAVNGIPFQEFMVVPIAPKCFAEAMLMGSEIYMKLKTIIKSRFGQNAINVGDEGGFAPSIDSVTQCLDLIMEAVKALGYESKVKIAMDIAASEFHCDDRPGYYNLDYKNGTKPNPNIVSGRELANLYVKLAQEYPIISIEDPFDQDDFESWTFLTKALAIQIVGDDLTVTNKSRIQKALEHQACNTLLLKVNQIGTLSESIDAANMAKSNGWGVMISHRSGETEDAFIADLAVGLDAGQIKSGAPCRSERLAKYNRLLRIEEEAGPSAPMAKPF